MNSHTGIHLPASHTHRENPTYNISYILLFREIGMVTIHLGPSYSYKTIYITETLFATNNKNIYLTFHVISSTLTFYLSPTQNPTSQPHPNNPHSGTYHQTIWLSFKINRKHCIIIVSKSRKYHGQSWEQLFC